MDTQHATPAMPRPDFARMTERALNTYLAKNRNYLSDEDPLTTREEILASAALVADRKAEDFVAARAEAELLNRAVDETSAALQLFPKGPLGLTPDEVKFSRAFITAQSKFNKAFHASRNFNRKYTKVFAEELRHAREVQRASRIAAFEGTR